MNLLKKINKLQLFLVICIFLLGAILRIFHLGTIPAGLTNDEANTGYDAYSILKTGKDQWGEKQPSTALKGFGDYRTPLYTYAVVPSVAMFGLSEFSVRLPSAVFGSLTVLLVFFLALLLFENITTGIIAMFFLAFNPWHIAMSRTGIESTLGVFIVTLAISLFFLGLSKKKFLYVSAVIFALAIYSYTSYIVLAPVLFILLCIIFRKHFLRNRKSAFISIVLFLIVALPVFVGGNLKTASVRSNQVNLTHDVGIINIVNDKRGACQSAFQNKICKIFQNKYSGVISAFVANYFNHFSPSLLATSGTQTQYSVLQQRGLLYITEYIFFIVGLFFLFKKPLPQNIFVLGWLFFAPIPDSITGNGHYSRFMTILPALQLTSALGVYGTLSLLPKKALLYFALGPIIAYEICAFLITYTTYFPKFYSSFSLFGYKNLFSYIETVENNYDKVIISSRVNDTKQYVYYLFYTKYDPSLFQKGTEVEKEQEAGGWIRVKRIGKINFLSSLSMAPVDKRNIPHVLLVGAPIEFTKKVIVEKRIKDLNNNVIFSLVDLRSNPTLAPTY